MLEKECFWKICLYEKPYFPVDPHVSGNAFLWKFSQSKKKKSRRRNGCLSVVTIVCCQVEVSASG